MIVIYKTHSIDTDKKYYQCIRYDEAFSNNNYLRKPLMMNTGEKSHQLANQYICNYCSKNFSKWNQEEMTRKI